MVSQKRGREGEGEGEGEREGVLVSAWSVCLGVDEGRLALYSLQLLPAAFWRAEARPIKLGSWRSQEVQELHIHTHTHIYTE